MSTRCAIARKAEDGTIRAMYCHHDGDIGYVGAILNASYATPERIKALLALGDISGLGKYLSKEDAAGTFYGTYDVCRVYARDGGEELRPNSIYQTREQYQQTAPKEMDAEYLYLFEGGKWAVYPVYWKTPPRWYDLAALLEKMKGEAEE